MGIAAIVFTFMGCGPLGLILGLCSLNTRLGRASVIVSGILTIILLPIWIIYGAVIMLWMKAWMGAWFS